MQRVEQSERRASRIVGSFRRVGQRTRRRALPSDESGSSLSAHAGRISSGQALSVAKKVAFVSISCWKSTSCAVRAAVPYTLGASGLQLLGTGSALELARRQADVETCTPLGLRVQLCALINDIRKALPRLELRGRRTSRMSLCSKGSLLRDGGGNQLRTHGRWRWSACSST